MISDHEDNFYDKQYQSLTVGEPKVHRSFTLIPIEWENGQPVDLTFNGSMKIVPETQIGKAPKYFLELNILEIFVIDEVLNTNPVTYRLVDMLGEKITGSFYEAELQRTTQDIFRIEKVIRRDQKKKKALVKWKGYSDKCNAWIPLSDAEKLV